MTIDVPETIFGWTPSAPPIVAAGALIAAVLVAIALTVAGPVVPLGGSVIVPMLIVCGLAWLTRVAFRRRRIERLTVIVMLCVAVKLANLVAIVLLGLATVAMFLLGYPAWNDLGRALILSLIFATVLSLLTSTIGNLEAFRRARPE